MKARKGDHVLVGPGPGIFTCRHCGRRLELALPQNVDDVLAAMRSFMRDHKRCPAPVGSGAER